MTSELYKDSKTFTFQIFSKTLFMDVQKNAKKLKRKPKHVRDKHRSKQNKHTQTIMD